MNEALQPSEVIDAHNKRVSSGVEKIPLPPNEVGADITLPTEATETDKSSDKEPAIDPVAHLGLLTMVATDFLYNNRNINGKGIVFRAHKHTFYRASALTGYSRELDDVIQDGWFGLQRASVKFDPAYGCSFSTYAFLLIGQALSSRSSEYIPIRMPARAFSKYLRKGTPRPVKTIPNEVELDYHGYDDAGESSEMTRYAESDLIPTVPANDDIDYNVEDLFDKVEWRASADFIGKLMDKALIAPHKKGERPSTDHRATDIIRKRFGFDGEIMTLQEIGDEYGLTRERVRQIEYVSLEKMRKAAKTLTVEH